MEISKFGLGFGVWGLGFRVWGLGFTCGDIEIAMCFLRVLVLSTEGDAAATKSSDTETLGLIETKLRSGFRV